jgi:AraC-like DNA-binding protein
VIIRCYLSPQSLARVQHAFPPPHCVGNAGTWAALVSELHHRRCDAAIVDPCADGDHRAQVRLSSLTQAMALAPSIPVIGYVSVTASAIRVVQALVRSGALEIVIRGVDDSRDALAGAIHRAVATCGWGGVVNAVEAPLRALPFPVATAIQTAFTHPERVRAVSDLATAAGMTRRSLDRWLARVGFSSARTVLSCARVNAAFHLLAGGSTRVAEAALLVGYPSSRSLTRELRAITGCPASEATRVSRDAFAATIGRRLVRCQPSALAPCSSY